MVAAICRCLVLSGLSSFAAVRAKPKCVSFWLTRNLGPDQSGQKPKPAITDVQLDEPTESHRLNHYHRCQAHLPKVSDAFHHVHLRRTFASESLGRSYASDCNFRGLLGFEATARQRDSGRLHAERVSAVTASL